MVDLRGQGILQKVLRTIYSSLYLMHGLQNCAENLNSMMTFGAKNKQNEIANLVQWHRKNFLSSQAQAP